MAVNPVGMVKLADFGIPQTFGAISYDVVSGGQYCYSVSGAAPVSSGANSYALSDIKVVGGASGTNYPVGVAIQNIGSNLPCGVMTRGIVISRADGGFTTGAILSAENGADCVMAIGSQADPMPGMSKKIGKSLTAAGSAEYAIVLVNCE